MIAMLTSRLAGDRRAELARIERVDELLAAQHATGAAAWPTVALAPERYIAHLAQRIEARADETAMHVICTMPAADLYIVAACTDGTSAALTAFRDAFIPLIRRSLSRLQLSAAAVDETVQRMLLMLFVEQRLIDKYAGRGPLRAWLRTIAVRTGRRVAGTDRSTILSERLMAALPAAGDPELDVIRERYRDPVREAVTTAFARLDHRQRDALRRYYLEGFTIDELGATYSVNRATAARWVAAARLAVLKETRAHLAELLGASSAEVESLMRVLRSQIQLSMRFASGLE